MSSLIKSLLCHALTISLKIIEFITSKACMIWCQCMKRFPGCFWIIVRIFIVIFFVALSIFLALVSYIFLYWLMIPSLHYERPIYFDYTLPSPSSIINIDQHYEWYLFDLPFESIKQHQDSLRPNEIYDVTINLHIPSKQSMHDIGNVMLKLSLYSCSLDNREELSREREAFEYLSTDKYQTKYGWNLLRTSTRPILLKYESALVRIIKKIIFIVPYTFGLWQESLYLKIPITVGFEEVDHNPTCAAVVRLSTNQFNVYDASIYFDIQLQGIKYYLYHWWLTSSVLTVFVFSLMCCIGTSPGLVLCCYQVTVIRDCYRKQNVVSDEDEHEEEHEIEEYIGTAPIAMLETTDIQSATVSSDISENTSVFQSSVQSPVSSALLSTVSSSVQSGDDETLMNIVNQNGLRRRI
eukprot:117830_1